MNAVQKLIDKAKTDDKAGLTVLAELFDVSRQAVDKFGRQGWMPVDRARVASQKYDIPIRDLVRPDIAAAMDQQAAQTA